MKPNFCHLIINQTAEELCDSTKLLENFANLQVIADYICCIDDELNAFGSGRVKAGETIKFITTLGASWSWSGPNSFTSTDQNPTIPNASAVHQGLYTVEVTDAAGCVSRHQSYVWVDQPVCIQDLQANLPDPSTIDEGVIFFATDANDAKLLCGGAWIDFPIGDTRVEVNQGGPFPVPALTGNVDRLGEIFMATDGMLYYVDLNGNSQKFASSNIYNIDDSLTSNRTVTGAGFSLGWVGLLTWAVGATGKISWDSASGEYQFITLPPQDNLQDRLLAIDATGNVVWRDQASVLGPEACQRPYRISAKPIVCEGDNIELFADGPVGSTYAWTGPDSFVSATQNPVIATSGGDVALKSGRYQVVITNGVCEETLEVYVSVVFCPGPEAFIF